MPRRHGHSQIDKLRFTDYRQDVFGDSDGFGDARSDCIENYLNYRIDMDNVLWFMDRLPQFKGYRKQSSIATVDDEEGNETVYLFADGIIHGR